MRMIFLYFTVFPHAEGFRNNLQSLSTPSEALSGVSDWLDLSTGITHPHASSAFTTIPHQSLFWIVKDESSAEMAGKYFFLAYIVFSLLAGLKGIFVDGWRPKLRDDD